MEHYLTHFAKLHTTVLPTKSDSQMGEIVRDLKPESYHGMQTFISSSGLKEICESPRHYLQWLYENQTNQAEPEKDHFRFGRIAHLMVLEPNKFKESFVEMPDFGNMRTNAAKEKKELWLKDQKPGAVFMTAEELQTLKNMVDSIMSHKVARGLFSEGEAETSFFFSDEETKIKCRARPDLFRLKDRWIVDFKTTRSSKPGLFSYAVNDYKYHLQLAFYSMAVKACTGEDPEACVFVAVEKEPPFDTMVFMADEQMLARGKEWARWSLNVLSKCIDTGKWPGRQQDEAQIISLPRSADFEIFPEINFD